MDSKNWRSKTSLAPCACKEPFLMGWSGGRFDFVHPVIGIQEFGEIYLFLDKRTGRSERFCRSIFPRHDLRDYTKGQTKWTLLYERKVNLSSGSELVVYQHRLYKTEKDVLH
ncbi:MAG: hypothetical protein J6D22_01670 [Pyramidobacter sp.]|nr:hypothetical protein [Pyramidobacter sp.]